MQLYCVQISKLDAAGKVAPTLGGLAKLHNTSKARVFADAPDMLGGNGILLGFHVIGSHGRHRVHLHLPRHRNDPVPHHRPRYHRHRRVPADRLVIGGPPGFAAGGPCAPPRNPCPAGQ